MTIGIDYFCAGDNFSKNTIKFKQNFITSQNTSSVNTASKILTIHIARPMREKIFLHINNLKSPSYLLKKPFLVCLTNLTNNINEIIGEIPELELYCFGNDENEVLNELKEDIIDLYQELIKLNNDRLGKNPKKWKEILDQHIGTL